MIELTPDFITAEFIKKSGSILEVAKEHAIPVDKLEAYCFSLCKKLPDKFEYKYFLSKDWFIDKLSKYDTLVEIANATGIHYRTLCYLKQKVLPVKSRHLSKEISYAELWKLYIEDEMTDKAIAKKYSTTTESIKRLRHSYDIMSCDRIPLESKLPIELFYRMYVISRLGLGQIANLYNTSRISATELKDKYADMGHPLSQAIANTNNAGYSPRFMGDLLQMISKADLCQELRTKTIFEVAAQYKLIAPTSNSLTPLSKEWFKAELLTKSVSTIAKENNISTSRAWVLISEYGLDGSSRTTHINKKILWELFINRCWSDSTIAKHLGVSPNTVKRDRLGYKIYTHQRPSAEERISAEMFRYLYIEERMNLVQIGSAFGISDAKIRELRKKYIKMGHTDFAHRTSNRITLERLEYLYKQIHLGLLKK